VHRCAPAIFALDLAQLDDRQLELEFAARATMGCVVDLRA